MLTRHHHLVCRSVVRHAQRVIDLTDSPAVSITPQHASLRRRLDTAAAGPSALEDDDNDGVIVLS